jgi:DNA repair protein RecO (recombination protein O)
VLRRKNIGETDRVVTLYTREKGKLSAVAKGARKHLSKLAGPSEMFTYGRYFLASGRDMDIITQADVQESFPGIRKDLNKIAHATYLAELTNALVEERDPNYDLFDTLLSALYLLESDADPGVVARYFDLQVMSLMGYRPEIDSCVRCGRRPSTPTVAFSPSAGGIVCRECGPIPDDVIQISRESVDAMRQLLTIEPRAVRELQFSDAIKTELTKAIRWYVRYRLDQDLKSTEFIQAIAGT